MFYNHRDFNVTGNITRLFTKILQDEFVKNQNSYIWRDENIRIGSKKLYHNIELMWYLIWWNTYWIFLMMQMQGLLLSTYIVIKKLLKTFCELNLSASHSTCQFKFSVELITCNGKYTLIVQSEDSFKHKIKSRNVISLWKYGKGQFNNLLFNSQQAVD